MRNQAKTIRRTGIFLTVLAVVLSLGIKPSWPSWLRGLSLCYNPLTSWIICTTLFSLYSYLHVRQQIRLTRAKAQRAQRFAHIEIVFLSCLLGALAALESEANEREIKFWLWPKAAPWSLAWITKSSWLLWMLADSCLLLSRLHLRQWPWHRWFDQQDLGWYPRAGWLKHYNLISSIKIALKYYLFIRRIDNQQRNGQGTDLF